jgi:hypothetical protein
MGDPKTMLDSNWSVRIASDIYNLVMENRDQQVLAAMFRGDHAVTIIPPTVDLGDGRTIDMGPPRERALLWPVCTPPVVDA